MSSLQFERNMHLVFTSTYVSPKCPEMSEALQKTPTRAVARKKGEKYNQNKREEMVCPAIFV